MPFTMMRLGMGGGSVAALLHCLSAHPSHIVKHYRYAVIIVINQSPHSVIIHDFQQSPGTAHIADDDTISLILWFESKKKKKGSFLSLRSRYKASEGIQG